MKHVMRCRYTGKMSFQPLVALYDAHFDGYNVYVLLETSWVAYVAEISPATNMMQTMKEKQSTFQFINNTKLNIRI